MKGRNEDSREGSWLVVVVVAVLLVEVTAVTFLVAEGKNWRQDTATGEKGECIGCYRDKEICQLKTIEKRGGGCVKREEDEECLGERVGTFGWRYCY
jgi:hypothetical protein